MGQAQSVSRDTQAQLAARVEAIGHRLRQASIAETTADLQALRRLAKLHRLGPAVTVIAALETALGRGETGPLVEGWLAILREAIGCERFDDQTCDLFAAACSVRLVA